MGFDARPTRINAQEVDNEVYSPSGKKLLDLQVKSRHRYRDWMMGRKHEKSIESKRWSAAISDARLRVGSRGDLPDGLFCEIAV
jgi:hypothetical protein